MFIHNNDKQCENIIDSVCNMMFYKNKKIFFKNICEACLDAFHEKHKYEILGEISNNNMIMYNLAHYYRNKKMYSLMKYYLLLSAKHKNSEAMCDMGHFYCRIGDYYSTKIYYLSAIKQQNTRAMHNLGYYYQHVEKNVINMIKYYLMSIYSSCSHGIQNECNNCAIENGNIKSMVSLGHYYQTQKKYDDMIKYYMLAIECKCPSEKNKIKSTAMHNLGRYYYKIKNYDLMKKYYGLACDYNNSMAMCDLGRYYKNIEKNYDLMKQYYLRSIEKENDVAIYEYGLYYDKIEKDYTSARKYYLMLIDKGKYPQLIDKFNVIELYIMLKNCNFVMSNISITKRMKIINFKKNYTPNAICGSCFLEKQCSSIDDIYLCCECY